MKGHFDVIYKPKIDHQFKIKYSIIIKEHHKELFAVKYSDPDNNFN